VVAQLDLVVAIGEKREECIGRAINGFQGVRVGT
jgi:hypothetical protein